MPFFLIYLSSWLGISGGIYGLFSKAGEAVKDESKIAVSKWIQNIELEKEAPNWPATFASLFDRVFTERHFSWKCFRRSGIASFTGVIIMTLIFVLITQGSEIIPNEETSRPNIDTINVIMPPLSIILTFLTLFICFNLITDYISLLESRYIIKKMEGTQSIVRWISFMTIDLLITFLVFIILGFGLFTSITILSTSLLEIQLSSFNLTRFIQTISNSISLSGEVGFMGIFLYTTFFTSIWIWLYAGSGLLIKFIVRSGKFLSFFSKHLNIEENPFKAMGFVLIILISIAYLIGGAIMLIT